MLEAIKNVSRALFTGKDNQTHDLGRVSWAGSLAATIGGAIWNAVHAGVVDLAQLSQAIAVVVGAHGAALWAKKDTEPTDK